MFACARLVDRPVMEVFFVQQRPLVLRQRAVVDVPARWRPAAVPAVFQAAENAAEDFRADLRRPVPTGDMAWLLTPFSHPS